MVISLLLKVFTVLRLDTYTTYSSHHARSNTGTSKPAGAWRDNCPPPPILAERATAEERPFLSEGFDLKSVFYKKRVT